MFPITFIKISILIAVFSLLHPIFIWLLGRFILNLDEIRNPQTLQDTICLQYALFLHAAKITFRYSESFYFLKR